jgi:hypothetical protein
VMTDFEDQLRAAMNASVASRQPPPGLVELVRRRRRRHFARVTVTSAAVVLAAAAAIPPARSALLDRGAGPAMSSAFPAPGSFGDGQSYGCGAQTLGALDPDWRQGATHAGPVWIINNGIAPDFRFANPDGTLKAVPLIVLVRDGTTAWVSPEGPQGQYFRFLPTVNGTDQYTLRDGTTDATFTSCAAKAAMFGSGLTEYYIGVIVSGPRCIPVDVRTSATGKPVRASLRFGSCASGR